jgi:hypothetical protein
MLAPNFRRTVGACGQLLKDSQAVPNDCPLSERACSLSPDPSCEISLGFGHRAVCDHVRQLQLFEGRSNPQNHTSHCDRPTNGKSMMCRDWPISRFRPKLRFKRNHFRKVAQPDGLLLGAGRRRRRCSHGWRFPYTVLRVIS